jgi:hypothetical protein
MWKAAILLFFISLESTEAFSPGLAFQSTATLPSVVSFRLSKSRSILNSTEGTAEFLDNDADEELEPGKMRASEIKSELNLRGIGYTDCFDKESLVGRLEEARATGRADPKIRENFNKQKIEEMFKEEKVQVNDKDMQSAVANDGKFPGGLTPDQFKKLASNPEVMTMLQSTQIQDAMGLMMTGERGELEQRLKEDPELQETIAKLDGIMKSLQ